ncbi:hypothetical protein Tco_0663877 [Tanacetum coccineum]
MAGGHAYHEGEEILKEDKKEYEFQWALRNQGNRNGDATRRTVPVETHVNALVVQDGIGHKGTSVIRYNKQVQEGVLVCLCGSMIQFLRLKVKQQGLYSDPIITSINIFDAAVCLSFGRELVWIGRRGILWFNTASLLFVNAANSWLMLPIKGLNNLSLQRSNELFRLHSGYDWSYQAEEGPTNFALMAHLSSGSSSSSSSNTEVQNCSKECLKSYETLQKQYDQQRDALKKYNLEIIGYQLGIESLEARIVVNQKNEAVYEEDIAFLKYDVKVRDNSIIELKNQLAEALKEKDDLKLKLEKFETSSIKLTKLINSQISVNNKSGVRFDSQMNDNELHDCHLNKSEVFESASDSSVNEIEEENNQVNDRFKKVEGYHAVPPPYTRNYMPSRPDLSFAGLDDSVYKTNMSETITSVPRNESTASKSSKDSLEQPKDVRPSAPIIEE